MTERNLDLLGYVIIPVVTCYILWQLHRVGWL